VPHSLAAATGTRGASSPLGATPYRDGTNFSLFSRHAAGVELLLFDRALDAQPARAIRLGPVANRTYHYWHAFVPGVTAGPGLFSSVTWAGHRRAADRG
jgi:isoamylase